MELIQPAERSCVCSGSSLFRSLSVKEEVCFIALDLGLQLSKWVTVPSKEVTSGGHWEDMLERAGKM